VSQRRRKIHRGRGLAYAALLVRHRNDPCAPGEWGWGRRKDSSPTLEVTQLLGKR
jgi:hypothetical protein